jgi:putative nucleotidyltransferase with HDIG domain
MPDARAITRRFWPRHGIMATEAGRHVVGGVFRLTMGGLAIAFVVLGLLALTALGLGLLPGETLGHLALGAAGAALAVGVAFAALPLLGRLSGLGDDVRLLELCDPGAPLLREMLESAPGTYNHSIMAGAMAEAAAHEIGANALLTRAGAYYHDVGKISRPRFFAENQMATRNPHDGASPEQSALVIMSHVDDGVDRARRERLPEPVIDIIAQHHGTSLVTFFYRKAAACGLVVDEAPFRYHGVIPRSREAALVMLADSAEAAGRALADCGPVQIEDAVRRVTDAKRRDGQLADSGLSESELETTVTVYAKMLSGQRHARVQYPDATPEGVEDAGESQLEPGP